VPFLLAERARSEGPGEGGLDGLLCSCNARSQKTLVGHAQWETILAHPPRKTIKECGPLMSAVKASPVTPYENEASQEMDARCGDQRSQAGITIPPLVVTWAEPITPPC
jgi:hypothetical protein